jgi:Cu2+-exporting ATPase
MFSIFTIPLFCISMFFMELPNFNLICLMLSTPIVFWAGSSFYRSAFYQFRSFSLGMDSLVALSTAVAYIYSLFITIATFLNLDHFYWHHNLH